MLSVFDGRSRARSKSRERSRTRDEQAPSPVARGPPPSSRRKQAYESDSEAVSDGDSDDARYDRRRRDDRERDRYESYREDDRKRTTYEDDRDRDRRRRDYDNDDDQRIYSKPPKQEYSHPEPSRQGSYGREKDKYELPGTYKDYEDRETQMRGGDRYSVASPTEVSHSIRSGSNSGRSGMYAQPAKYEYAKAPAEVRYLSKGEPFSPSSERGPSYTAKPAAEIEIERRRHKREQEEEELMKKYEEAQLQKKREELERAELIKKYERELELSKRKDEDQRRLKYKEESSDDDEYEYRRLNHANEEHEKEHEIERELIPKGTLPSKKYAEIEPENRRAPPSKLASGSEHRVVEIRPRENSTSLKPLESGVRRLSVSGGAGALTLMAPGGHHGPIGGGLPPGSPLLEAYRGTYQSISPMPSPMALPSSMDDGLSDLEGLDEDDPHIIKPRKIGVKKHVVIYDPEHDAKILGDELKHSKPSAGRLIKVLPPLSDDNILALRTEYKKHFKSQGKGINVAKHIKVKFTGNIGKILYATALGRWESEAYWANCWYQAGSSRRELLIESLLGRPNTEIRKIKGAFRDKRYNDSLEKCMQTELKKDKFRHAVLLALKEERMDEITPVSRPQVRADVDALYKALTSREGGETAMIDIIVVRSDNHLREVLKEYEVKYRANFARQMITKSQNLVGETLAHILNGVLNKPVRDALLLHQALAETSKDRAELLMSRLIRYHWDRKHMEKVKLEYRNRYKTMLEDDIKQAFTRSDFGEFCIALCEGATR
ncbi:MAG: hypothetical protein GOMPHAMPRED_001798 [Gomphillus americanus]|uniref:Annexin n=1 Tax=Gomphillus americanus TaxID=1940652 RepID=A0A8H3FB66_9LECA|nr:MAG: hypothetical protein GOMPHAMPRED_001798 [Gomphillus americanus]